MKRPNLFILGAPKCGTTAMASWLSSHSQVFVSSVKEPHHFSSDYPLTPDRAAYEALFADATERHDWVCEASVWQLHSDPAVPNILNYAPDARFIVMVRNPLQMVPSMHRQQLNNGNEKFHDLGRALSVHEARLEGQAAGVRAAYPTRHLAYLKSCALGWQVARAMDRIAPENLHVIVHDDLARDPRAVFAGVLDFLDLKAEAPIEFSRVNAAKVRRVYALNTAARGLARLGARLGITPGTGLINAFQRWNLREQPIAATPPQIETALRAAFADDVARLGQLLDRDLSHWLAPKDAPGPT